MLDDHISAVKDVIAIFLRNVDKNPIFKDRVDRLNKTLAYLFEQKRLAAPIPRSLGDISDLPEELVRELSVKKTDELEDQILTVMRACPGEVANLDQVLVGLYRKFKVIQTRRYLQNKMYRMGKKELVYQVHGSRASYSLEPQPLSDLPVQNGYDVDNAVAPSRPGPVNDLDDDIPF